MRVPGSTPARAIACLLSLLLLATAARATDTDGDGIPDGDWRERREYAYTVRSIVQVMRPAQAITDDYQDARVLDETDEYVELACRTGGVTTSDARYVLLQLIGPHRERLVKGVPYRLRPRNGKPARRWVVREGLTVTRKE